MMLDLPNDISDGFSRTTGQFEKARHPDRLFPQQRHHGVAPRVGCCDFLHLAEFVLCALAQQGRMRARRRNAVIDADSD